MKALLSRFTFLAALLATLSPRLSAQSVFFTSGGFSVHQSQGSATVCIQGTGAAQLPSVYVHSTNSTHGTPSTAIILKDYTTNSTFTQWGPGGSGEGAGFASLSVNNSIACFSIPLLVDSNLVDGQTIICDFWSGIGVTSPSTCTIKLLSDPLMTLACTQPTATQLGPIPGQFVLTRSGEQVDDITVNLATSGTAVLGTDYTLSGTGVSGSTVTISAGTTNITVYVNPVVNNTPGPNKTATLSLASGIYKTNTVSYGTVTIINKNPVVTVTATDTNASRSGGSGMFTITRTADLGFPLTVFYSLAGTATNGVDYAFLSNSITILSEQSFANVTVAPIFNNAITTNRTVTLTLSNNSAYHIGTPSNATVTIAPFDDNSRAIPTNSLGLLYTSATNGEFVRVPWYDPTYESLVVPVDLEKGVALDNVGGNSTNLFPTNTWPTALYHFNGTNAASSNNISLRVAFQNPMAAFGSRVGGSPLYFGQSYTFGVYAGDPKPSYASGNTYTNALRIQVIDRNTFTNIATVTISIPDATQTNAWAAFLTNGYSTTVTAYGLTTTLYFDNPYETWGALASQGHSDVSYHLSHTASDTGTNYIYEVELSGGTDYGWMVMDSSGNRAWDRLYTLEFETRPPWRSLIVQLPQFQGQPMPPTYDGASLDELLTNAPLVTNAVSVGNPSSYTNIDQSPELRRHPILDQFVSSMGNDPIALANYVINNIQLTDAIDYNDNGSVSDTSINLGGVNRGAISTFLEGEGSPTEQCALLVYLLRQAKVPAVYLFPPHDGMLMLDSRLSKMLRVQIHGAINASTGTAYTTNILIPVNYPWVAAYIGTNWVHIFPWIKDTSITQGFNVWDYMPTNYNNAFKWSRQYLYGDTNILNLSGEDDTPNTLLPLFVKQQLAINAPTVSFEDLGVTAYDRPHYYSRWQDFPMPNMLTNTETVVESLGSSSITNVLPSLTNIFNTVSVTVQSVANPTNMVSTGDMRLAELINRRFIVRHVEVTTNQHTCIISMESFRTNVTTTKDFSTLNLNDSSNTNILCNLMSSNTLGASDDALNVIIVHKRHRDLSTSFSVPFHWTPYLGLSSTLAYTNSRPLSKGDLAAICLNVGRVSSKMLQQDAQEVWQMEQQVAANPSITNTLSPDVYQGSVAYLMGMSYYGKLDQYKSTLEHVLGSHTTLYASGLARIIAKRDPTTGLLPNGTITLNQPMVDMSFWEVALFGNSTVRSDSGDNGYGPLDEFDQLFITGGSAQEHAAINTFFGQTEAISTVKLLRMAQQEASPGIIVLNKNNYIAQGNTAYPTGSTNLLKNYVPSIWQIITNQFTSAYISNYVQVYITPGLITNATASYAGMGAMIYANSDFFALISPNLNGGWGETTPDQTFNVANTPNYNLAFDETAGYSFDATPPTTSAPAVTPSVTPPAEFATTYSQIQSGQTQLNGTETTTLQQFQQQDALSSGTSQQDRLKDLENVGGQAQDVVRNPGEFVYDPVNMVTGEFYVDSVDLQLNGPMPLQVRRNYSSQNLYDNGLGYGWKLNYMPFLSVSSDSNLVYCAEAEGTVVAYRRQVTNANLWLPTFPDNPRLQNSTGSIGNLFNSTLLRVTNSSGTNFVLTEPDGEVRTYKVQSFPISTLTRSRPYLVSWQDAQSNSFTFSYGTNSANNDFGQVNRIKSSNGNFLDFDYDVYGHILDAYTGDGRMVIYDYDQYGDLVDVVRPDDTEISYEYQHLDYTNTSVVGIYSSHLLVKEDKPEGRVLQNDYDSQRRVINQYATVGEDSRLIRNASFVYSNNFAQTNSVTNLISGSTFVTDYLTNVTRYDYTNSFITNTVDPLGHSETQVWFANTNDAGYYPHSVKFTVDKRGLTNSFQYFSNGNIQYKTLSGDLTGTNNGMDTATWSYAYTANFLPQYITDPNGNTTYVGYDSTYTYLPGYVAKYNATGYTFYRESRFYTTNTDGTNIAYGLMNYKWRQGGTNWTSTSGNNNTFFTEAYSYNAQGFLTGKTQYASTALYPGSSANDVVTSCVYNERGELIQQTDAAGRYSTFAYDGMGRPTARETFEAGQTNPMDWTYSYYNENGELIWTDGPRYNPEDYIWRDYDGAGRMTQEVHWLSQAATNGSGVQATPGDGQYATTFREFDPFGNLIKVIDPRGNYARNSYDAIGELLVSKQFDGSAPTNSLPLAVTQYSYEKGGSVASITNALGGVTSNLYTSTGKLKFQQNPNGSTHSWAFDLTGRVVRETLANGSYWQTAYNDGSNILTKTFYNATNAPLETNVTQLDMCGNVLQTVDGLGNVWTNSYEGLGRISVAAGPATITVANVGLLPGTNFVTNILQEVTTYLYDNCGKVTTVSNALGETTTTTKDAIGRTVQVAVYNSNSVTPVRFTSTYYSPDHNSATVTNGSGANAIVATTYTDTRGNPLLVIGYPTNGVTEFTWWQYDMAGNKIAQAQCSSNSSGILTWATNGWTYDGLNRVVVEVSRDGATNTYSYDALGDVTNRTMPGNLVWSAAYTNDGRITAERESGGSLTARSMSYTYYGTGSSFAGRLQTVTDGRGTTRSNSYDNFLRLATVTTTGTAAQQKTTTTYQYDVRNLLTNLNQSFASTNTGPSTTILRSYDQYGHILGENVSVGGSLLCNMMQTWDAAGRRSQLNGVPYNHQADGLMIASDGSVFAYGNNGLLTARTNANRVYLVNQRDGKGRALQTTTTVGISTALSETLTWRNDGRLTNYVAVRGDFTDSRSYTYSALAQRVTQETLNVGAMQSLTNNYTIDNGAPGGLGILTSKAESGTATATWSVPSSGGLDGLSRVSQSQNTLINRPAYGLAVGAGIVTATLDGNPVDVQFNGSSNGLWRANLELASGSHTLSVNAVDPSGLFSGSSNSTFTVASGAVDTVSNSYDLNGNITQRVWVNNLGQTNRIDTLTWDAFDRLIQVSQRDTNSSGFDFVSIYDGLGRRVRTVETFVTNGLPITSSGSISIVDSWYDPQVEFLETAVSVNGTVTVKTYGPDVNGVYGGMQGVGGLESLYRTDHFKALGSVQDYFGNIIGTITNGTTVMWNPARFSSYGPVPGYQPLTLSLDTPLEQTVGWHGWRMDPDGCYHIGKRRYSPVEGRFLSADPLGHAASMDLYSYCGGDPVNHLDPDGRLGKGFYQAMGQTAQGFLNLAQNAYYSVDYGLTALAYGSDQANQWYGQNWQGLKNTVGGTAQTAYDMSAFASYALVSPFDNDAAYHAYGNSMPRLGQSATAFTGGADNSTAYRLGYTTFGVGALFVGGEAGEMGEGATVAGSGMQIAENTASAIADRQAVAKQFYQNAGFTDQQITSHISGIDFNQPVQVTTLQPGTQVVQYQIPGNPIGNYFAPVGTSANTLGIYTSGLEGTQYTLSQRTSVLQSTAASTVDTWSMTKAGWNIQVQGGGTQFFMPARSGLIPTP